MRIHGVVGLALAGFSASCASVEGDVGSAEQALTYEQIVEAEDATGAGVVSIDASASGGEYLRNTIVLTTASATFTTTGAILDGVVRARRGDTLCMPLLHVRVDGVLVAVPVVSATDWTDYPLSVSAPPGTHTITFYYRNGVNGCALDVDEATFTIFEPDPPPPTTLTALEAELATGDGTVGTDAAASAGEYRAFTAPRTSATLAFSLPDPLVSGTVRVRGGWCGPMGRVRIDGLTVWEGTVYSSEWTEMPLSVPAFAAGPHTLEFSPRSVSASCPLHFDVVNLLSTPPPPPPPPPVTTVIEAESAIGDGTIEIDASASNGQLREFTASRTSASVSFTTTGTLLQATLSVRGGSCAPFGSVSLDGVTVWSGAVYSGTWIDVGLGVAPLPAGDHTLTFTSRSASTMCALRYDSVTLVTEAP